MLRLIYGAYHVDVLELVDPVLGQAVVKPQERKGVHYVLVQRVIIAVDVVGHLNRCSKSTLLS